MAVIGVHYAEGGREVPLNYKSVYLHHKGGNKEFNSGNFIKDWYDCKKFISDEGILDRDVFISHSSSVDHFMMDGAPYDSAYLHVENEKPVLKYLDASIHIFEQTDIYQDGWEFFVPEGTQPTWEELKLMCGLIKI